ncbi:sensor histidine kinase [Flavilitoribacter nigricans]|uniref:Sensor histidine kinase n=1 Tax=Flavilitoribacter nigricans (strain ATCC 23147 / DSM 23189 / NBRC 102662 / NCIMB 1420 / SS-2) TaxID=1122177 RepID=A0A2D0NIH9_FLAN2|nr:histidine kinase [Flavilitoribacter nigricans]PHN08301.1 sensor histidine kinase [Flavilitoribacter nigricans DSM 23189 = NBRC 102662]
MKNFLQKRIFNISILEYLLVGLLYFFFAVCYHITLWLNRSNEGLIWEYLFSPEEFFAQAGLGYLIELLLTIPIWWLMFRKLRSWPLLYRLPVHLVLLPVFAFSFQQIYYFTAESLGYNHLQGTGSVWDIFIPAMFYLLQFGIFHAYEYYLDNQRNLKLKAALSEAALKSELSALKAQLNPHFLYNVFNTISASVPPQQERTREMIAQLSDLFRYQLKASRSDLVPLREELEFVQSYLELEKARFGDRLRVRIDVPEKLYEVMVPPMILQPLVENSIKHGIASLIEGGEISIRIRKNGNGVAFEVSDTGVGVEDTSQLFDVGLGLTNTKLRLEKQYGSELKISDNSPRGLKIAFAI